MINDLQNEVDYTYEGWDPNMQVWRAKETHPQNLPFTVVDYISTSKKKFSSLGDVVGRIDDIYLQFGYCELELVNISVHANKYHNNRSIDGRDFAFETLLKIRKRILGFWNSILYEFGASLERGINLNIRDLSSYKSDTGTRKYEYDMNVYLRTDVRWDTKPEGEDLISEKAKIAYITLQEKNNIRVVYNG